MLEQNVAQMLNVKDLSSLSRDEALKLKHTERFQIHFIDCFGPYETFIRKCFSFRNFFLINSRMLRENHVIVNPFNFIAQKEAIAFLFSF